MHAALFRIQRRVLGALLALLIAGGIGAGLVQSFEHNEAVEAVEVSQLEAQFWRAVAGEGSDSMPVVAARLARDLREVPASELDQFYASSNLYGGVSAAIGFDPFDETGLRCAECGPLDVATRENVRLIREGHLDQVLAATEVAAPDNHVTLTPLGTSVIGTVGALWLLGGPLALGIAWGLTTNEGSVRRFRDLSFERNGRSDVEKLGIIALAPSFMVPYLLIRRSTRQHFTNKVRSTFPEHMAIVDQTDAFLAHYGESQGTRALRERRDALVSELESQTRAGESGFSDPELTVLLEELNRSMEYLELRSAARRELGGLHGEETPYQR